MLASEEVRRQRSRWDALALRTPDLFPAYSTQYYRRCEIELIRRSFGPLRGKRVLKLDLWNEAFNTRILHWMQAEGATTFGLDASSVITRRAHCNHQAGTQVPLTVVQSDIRHLPFARESFDCVYTMGTIEHIDEYRAALSEVARVLRVGGRAIIGVPHKWNVFLRPLLVKILDHFDKYPYSPEKTFSAAELRRAVTDSGLCVIKRTGILSAPGIIRMADLFFFRHNLWLHRLTPLVLWPFDYLETHFRWPGFFGYLLAVVAEKGAENRTDRAV